MATGNHLLVPVKANQPTLFQHLTETYPAQPHKTVTTPTRSVAITGLSNV